MGRGGLDPSKTGSGLLKLESVPKPAEAPFQAARATPAAGLARGVASDLEEIFCLSFTGRSSQRKHEAE